MNKPGNDTLGRDGRREKPGRAWLWARVAITVIGFVDGVAYPFVAPDFPVGQGVWAHVFLVVGGLLGCVLMPLMLLGIIGLQVVNPASSDRWTVPSWRTNFLNFSDPLHFFHMAAFVVMACGAGMLIAAPFSAGVFGLHAIVAGLGGGSVLFGVRLCRRVYHTKFD